MIHFQNTGTSVFQLKHTVVTITAQILALEGVVRSPIHPLVEQSTVGLSLIVTQWKLICCLGSNYKPIIYIEHACNCYAALNVLRIHQETSYSPITTTEYHMVFDSSPMGQY